MSHLEVMICHYYHDLLLFSFSSPELNVFVLAVLMIYTTVCTCIINCLAIDPERGIIIYAICSNTKLTSVQIYYYYMLDSI